MGCFREFFSAFEVVGHQLTSRDGIGSNALSNGHATVECAVVRQMNFIEVTRCGHRRQLVRIHVHAESYVSDAVGNVNVVETVTRIRCTAEFVYDLKSRDRRADVAITRRLGDFKQHIGRHRFDFLGVVPFDRLLYLLQVDDQPEHIGEKQRVHGGCENVHPLVRHLRCHPIGVAIGSRCQENQIQFLMEGIGDQIHRVHVRCAIGKRLAEETDIACYCGTQSHHHLSRQIFPVESNDCY